MVAVVHPVLSDFFRAVARPLPLSVQHGDYNARSPITGETIAHVKLHHSDAVAGVVDVARAGFEIWRSVPMPLRGPFDRHFWRDITRA